MGPCTTHEYLANVTRCAVFRVNAPTQVALAAVRQPSTSRLPKRAAQSAEAAPLDDQSGAPVTLRVGTPPSLDRRSAFSVAAIGHGHIPVSQRSRKDGFDASDRKSVV